MPNPTNFDSDRDYYDACMTPKQRIMQAIDDGGREEKAYLDWGEEHHPELTKMELMADTIIMAGYAEEVIELETVNQEPS